jgi:hypothetical protein
VSTRRHAGRLAVVAGTLGTFPIPAMPAADDSPCRNLAADQVHCAAVAAPDARLACYDALTEHPPAAASAAARPTAAAAAAAVNAATPTPSAGPAPSPPLASPTDGRDFGSSKPELAATPNGPESIKALVATVSEDRLGHVYVRLDNGQTWTCVAEILRLSQGDSVTIRRASFGSFLMTAPSKNSCRVRRTQ